MVFSQVLAGVHAVIDLVGLPGNLLVIATICMESRFHVMRYVLLASLAGSDILFLIQFFESKILFHRKWFGHRLNNSLNCLAELWAFLRLKDLKISKWLYIIVLIVRSCFDWTHGLNKLFLHLWRALLLHNYENLSPIFSCKLLIRNHMIFLVQFGINKHL